MPVVFKDDPVFSNLRGNIKDVGNVMLQKKVKEQDEKKQVQLAMQKLILESALKNKQFKSGADLNALDTSQGMGSILGQINPMLEQATAIPQTSISISERPYTEMQKAREVLQRSPADYGKAGMAKKVGGSFLGIPTGGGFGSKWEINPEAQAEQAGAKTILGNPYKSTKRISYKGGVVDTTAQDVTNELPDPSSYDEGTIIEDDSGQQYKLENGEWVSQ